MNQNGLILITRGNINIRKYKLIYDIVMGRGVTRNKMAALSHEQHLMVYEKQIWTALQLTLLESEYCPQPFSPHTRIIFPRRLPDLIMGIDCECGLIA